MSKVHVIHENDAWVEPLRVAFARLGTPVQEWFLDRGLLDLRQTPPEGVYYNRMSASSHTRGHDFAPEYAAAVIAWLERHGRIVVNGSRALQLEISKVAQYEALTSLCAAIAQQYPVQHIAGHEHIAPGRKRDPGGGFDWALLRRGLAWPPEYFPA